MQSAKTNSGRKLRLGIMQKSISKQETSEPKRKQKNEAGIRKNQSIENFNQDVISEEKHRAES